MATKGVQLALSACPTLIASILLSLAACSGEEGESDSRFGSEGSQGDTTDGEGETTGAPESETGGSEESGSHTKFDLPDGPDAEEPEPEPCTKIDILYVVDNSGSMEGEQENLANSFPGFVDEMLGTLETAESLHIGVATTEPNELNAPECRALGAFVQASPMHGQCAPFANGRTWMEEDEPDLESSFTCGAQLGSGGSGDEKPMDALRFAVHPVHTGLGGCNDGFLRDDALLVAVVITDEEDDNQGTAFKSSGDPPDWFASVVEAKNGVESNVVVLSLVGQEQPNLCNGIPFTPEGAEPAFRIHEFTDMFTYGFHGDVCALDYAPFFHDAISVIDQACETFTPPEG